MVQRSDIHGDDLDARARAVLQEIIVEHISSGEPISSRSLARCGRFELSPASLRNVMADLEDLGYLQQPHTSAGRIPTDRGYRFFSALSAAGISCSSPRARSCAFSSARTASS